jgi:hypothetical protein
VAGRWRPATAGSWADLVVASFGQAAGYRRPGRGRVCRSRAGGLAGRPAVSGLPLGVPEFGAVATRMGSGMRTPVAEVSAPLVRGRGRRRRLALLPGLVEAAAAVPGEAEPGTNGGLVESWCCYQASLVSNASPRWRLTRPRVRVVPETRHGTLVEQLLRACRLRVDGVHANQLTGGWSSTCPAPVQDTRHATSADRHLPP